VPSEVLRTRTVRKQKPVHGEEAGTERRKAMKRVRMRVRKEDKPKRVGQDSRELLGP